MHLKAEMYRTLGKSKEVGLIKYPINGLIQWLSETCSVMPQVWSYFGKYIIQI